MGGTVCVKHGGGAPQVKAAARRRLEAMVDPALAALERAMRSNDFRAIVSAARVVLDRSGFPATTHLEIETATREEMQRVGQQLVNAVRLTFETLGLPYDNEVVRRVLAAAMRADGESESFAPPSGVTPIPREVRELLSRWWRGESRRPQLVEATVEATVEEEVAL